jgi:beta-lactamase superfamily II metal-dependent hydrolase
MPQTLEIHHVYVGHGDATIIAVLNETTSEYVFKLLIDASTDHGLLNLCEYIQRNLRTSVLDMVIASHYHDDHLRGIASGLGTVIEAGTILDVGGYDLTPVEPEIGTAVPNANPPQNVANPPYVPDATGLFKAYLEVVKFSALPDRMPPIQRNVQTYPGNFGVPLTLATINGVPVTLKCHAGNGYVQGTAARNTGGNADNPNNYCLAFIIEYGEFRYFTGGDLGGSGGSYYDHESLLAQYLAANYPNNGHVCAFKSNHHGSDHSNNTNFLNAMRPAVCVTSVGLHNGHKLPGNGFMTRLAASTTPNNKQGFFFTNLGTFDGADRRAQANGLFGARANTTFDAGNGTQNGGQTYVIRVAEHQNRTTQSLFSVWRGHSPNSRVEVVSFNCH